MGEIMGDLGENVSTACSYTTFRYLALRGRRGWEWFGIDEV